MKSNIIEIFGWVCTSIILIGFWLNANNRYKLAMIVWTIGDLNWIIYDYFINNWSHGALSMIIIVINIYGLIRMKRRIQSSRKINKISNELFS